MFAPPPQFGGVPPRLGGNEKTPLNRGNTTTPYPADRGCSKMQCKMQKTMQNATPTNGGYDTKTPIFIGSKFFFRMARRLHYILAWKTTTTTIERMPKWQISTPT